ncbi:MAG: zinc ribbon domain-containing protein [Lachnospiraceae bacterium]|nr:zinc ribbon domain-containing protein [Lachnospiraceae bacterium]
MKKCPMCGVNVEEHVTECPECGCPIADTSGFSLKSGSGTKKKSGNPMGRSMSTGSGLTDILRENDDTYDDYYGNSSIGGSMPISLSKTDIEGDYSVKKKSKIGKYIIRIILLAAVAYGIYFLITNVLLTDKAKSYNQALDYFVETINEDDVEKMEIVMPPYLDKTGSQAKEYLENLGILHINSYTVRDLAEMTDAEIDNLQESIKLETGKTARIKEGYSMMVDLKVTVEGDSSQYVNGSSFMISTYMEFINIKDNWYLQINAYENIDYN